MSLQLVTRPPQRTRLLAVAAVFIVAQTLSGCSDSEPGAGKSTSGQSGAASSGDNSAGTAESGSAEESARDQPSGVPVERPAFSMQLPKGFVDDTDEAMLTPTENEVDATKRKPGSAGGHVVGVDFWADFHFDTIQEAKELALETAKSTNPQQKFLGKATFAGEDALRVGGPGTYDGTHREVLEFLHDGDWFQVWVETYGGKRAATEILEHIESTWEWE